MIRTFLRRFTCGTTVTGALVGFGAGLKSAYTENYKNGPFVTVMDTMCFIAWGGMAGFVWPITSTVMLARKFGSKEIPFQGGVFWLD